MTTETASVLFTDIVGSTALVQRLGEDRADGFRRTHDALLAEGVSANGGRVVKGLGDGIMAVFGSAADAVAAGVAIQRAVRRHAGSAPEEAFEVRVGISVGDVAIEDGDCHGTAVIEAARLCEAAQGGQILVADLVRALTRGRGSFTFESVGDIELKGLGESVPTCYVGWDPEPEPAGDRVVPFPPLLAPLTSVGYSGRLDLRAKLAASWDQVESTTGSRVVLLAGEPGVGKTRTCSEVARDAHQAGALVLYGRCDEELALAYEPFVEALDWQSANDPSLPLGRFSGDLRRLVPDLAERIVGLPDAIRSDPRTEEHRLFEATAAWIADVSRASGLVLVMDDLHWATRPTLQLLLHVARAALADPGARLLLLATYRDTDVDRAHPLSSMLADLRRLPSVERISVDPLTEDEVLEFVARAAGHELDDAMRTLARRAYDETEGNPFFVGEVVRHFIEIGVVRFDDGRWVVQHPERVDVPEGVRDVVGRRLDRLSGQANEVLTAASVVGRDFTLHVVADVAELPVDDVVDILDEAIRARLVEETGPDRFRFAHALTRQTLYEELSSTRLRRIHRRVVESLERRRPEDVAALAHHSVEAGPVGGNLEPAIRYTLAAGQQAIEARALADADRYFRQTLELIEDSDGSHELQALLARCGLGEAQRDMGDPAFRATLHLVAEDALAADQVPLAVRAVIGNGRILSSIIGAVDEGRIAQLRSVLARLEVGAESTDRILLLATLAGEMASGLDLVEERLGYVDEAERLALASGDEALIARVISATSNAAAIPSRLDSRVPMLARAVVAADASGDPSLRTLARVGHGFLLGQHGEMRAYRKVLEQARLIADTEATPAMQWIARGFTHQLHGWDGDLVATRASNQANLELGQQLGEPDVLNWWGAVELGLRWSDGTAGELADMFGLLTAQYPELVGWRVFQAAALLEGDRRSEVPALVAEFGLDLPDLAREEMFTFGVLAAQVDLLLGLGRWDALAGLEAVLRPHRRCWALTGAWVFLPLLLPHAACLVAAGQSDDGAQAVADAWDSLVESGVRSALPCGALMAGMILDKAGTEAALVAAVEIVAHGLAEARDMGMDIRVTQLTEMAATLAAS